MKVMETFRLSKLLAETVGWWKLGFPHTICCVLGVKPPHEALIMPELYLHYSAVFLYGNKSLSFRVFADKVIENELKSGEKKKKK